VRFKRRVPISKRNHPYCFADSDGYRRDSGHVCTDTGTSTARSLAVARPLPGDLHGALREGVSPGSRGVLQVDPSGLAVRLLKHRFEPSEEPFANAVVIPPPPYNATHRNAPNDSVSCGTFLK